MATDFANHNAHDLAQVWDSIQASRKALEKEIEKRLKAGVDVPGFELKTFVNDYYRWTVREEVKRGLDKMARLEPLTIEDVSTLRSAVREQEGVVKPVRKETP